VNPPSRFPAFHFPRCRTNGARNIIGSNHSRRSRRASEPRKAMKPRLKLLQHIASLRRSSDLLLASRSYSRHFALSETWHGS